MIYQTIRAKLIASDTDLDGYITYVFQILDKNIIDRLFTDLIMCVRYPNWNHDSVKLGQIGYVKVREVKAGVDEWFDGVKMNHFKYDDVIFYKFIEEQNQPNEEIIL